MSIWIKICANTSFADAMIAAEAGADAVGFVFAPSPRRVTAEQVAAIVPELPSEIEKIGVFVGAKCRRDRRDGGNGRPDRRAITFRGDSRRDGEVARAIRAG